LKRSLKISIILGIIAIAIIASTVIIHYTISEIESSEIETTEQNEISSSYVNIIDGVQVVTIITKEFQFIPSEIHINAGKTKFVVINNGVSEHELVVYDISKKDIIDKAELEEDEETIKNNILFEIEEIHTGESSETAIMDLKEGSYVMGCHIAGHYEAGMTGTIIID